MIKKIVVLPLFFSCLLLHNQTIFSVKNLFTLFCLPKKHQKKNQHKKLYKAIIKNNKKKVERLLKNGADPNKYFESTNSCFKDLTKKIKIENVTTCFIPLILIAAIKSKIEIINLLITYGANVNQPLQVKTKKNKLITLKIDTIFFVQHKLNKNKIILEKLKKNQKSSKKPSKKLKSLSNN